MKTLNYLMLLTTITSATAYAEKWKDADSPTNFSSSYQYNFNALPTEYMLEDTGKNWSDSYWPIKKGTILNRWQQPSSLDYKKYVFPTRAQVLSMSPSALNLYSPAEKFDIIRGLYNFPLSTDIKSEKIKKQHDWTGICDGWTTSSIYMNEPKAILFKSPTTGLTVPLTSGDIKGLLAYYNAYIADLKVKTIGTSLRGKKFLNKDAFNDPNPGAFHVAMTNELGLLHKAVAMDSDPGEEVWNQPFIGYKTEILETNTGKLSKGHAKEAVKEVSVKTTMTYVNELYDTDDENLENATHVTSSVDALGIGKQHLKTVDYYYTLELDFMGRIVGGSWDSNVHPDLMWKVMNFDLEKMLTDSTTPDEDGNVDPSGDWAILREIVRQSTGQ